MPAARRAASPLLREFGDRVRSRRDELEISQEALAHAAGLQRAYIGQIETGLRSPGLDTLTRLARGLEMDLGDLMAGLQDFKGKKR